MTISQERKAELELARYYARRAEAVKILGGACVTCGSMERLEFDHINPITKLYNISEIWSYSWEIVQTELQKCQLLCHDCHKAKTLKEMTGLREHGTYVMYQRGKCRCGPCRAAFNSYRREWRRKTGRTQRSRGPNNKTWTPDKALDNPD